MSTPAASFGSSRFNCAQEKLPEVLIGKLCHGECGLCLMQISDGDQAMVVMIAFDQTPLDYMHWTSDLRLNLHGSHVYG